MSDLHLDSAPTCCQSFIYKVRLPVRPSFWQCVHLLSGLHFGNASICFQTLILTVCLPVVRPSFWKCTYLLSVLNLDSASTCCQAFILTVRLPVVRPSFWQSVYLMLGLHFDSASTCCQAFILTVRPPVARPSFWLAVHRSPRERGHEDESAGRCATGGESARQSEHASFKAPTNQSTRHTEPIRARATQSPHQSEHVPIRARTNQSTCHLRQAHYCKKKASVQHVLKSTPPAVPMHIAHTEGGGGKIFFIKIYSLQIFILMDSLRTYKGYGNEHKLP
jgi:hypothetical protein